MRWLFAFGMSASCASINVVGAPCEEMDRLVAEDRACVIAFVDRQLLDHCAAPSFDRGAWAREISRRRTRMLAASDEKGFYDELQQLVATVGDAHLNVRAPWRAAHTDFYEPHVTVAPIGERFVILRAEQIASGEELLRVDGQPLAVRVTEELAHVSGATKEARRREALRRALAGAEGSASVWQLRTLSGEVRQITVRRTRPAVELQPRVVAYRVEGNALYVRIPSFAHAELVAEFHQLLAAHTDALAVVVDLRDNGGGSNQIADPILSSFLPANSLIGVYHHHEGMRRTYSGEAPVRYDGPLAVLTSSTTCSSAEGFVAALRHHGRATLVGEATCGSPGIPHRRLDLPGGYQLRVPTGWVGMLDDEGRPVQAVQPDRVVHPTLAQARRGQFAALGHPARDQVLRRALDALGIN